MLWFKFILGLKFFEMVSILFAIVPDYGNEYTTKEKKNFAPKLNLNHNSDLCHASAVLYQLSYILCRPTGSWSLRESMISP